MKPSEIQRAQRAAALQALAAIQPIPGGVGGWESDGNDRRVLRPQRPFLITSGMLALARKKAAGVSPLAKLCGVRGHGRLIANEIRRLAGPSLDTLGRAVVFRDDGLCRHCGFTRERWQGGADCMENLQLLCHFCHTHKITFGLGYVGD